jgi:hypothetical protein
MSSSQYTKGLFKILTGEISLQNDDLRFVLVNSDEYIPQLDNHEYLSDIPLSSRIAISNLVTGKLISIDSESLPNPQIYFTSGVTNVTGPAGVVVEALALYKDTGDPSTSPLIAFFNGETISVILDGGVAGINVGLLGLLRWSR